MVESREQVRDREEVTDTGTARPRLRWIAEGHVEQVDMGPGGGPRLITAGRRGRGGRLASLVLEALDRAAEGSARIRVSREGWELFVDRPPDWPQPPRPVSAILAQGALRDPRGRPGEGQHEARRWAEMRARTLQLAEGDRELLRAYRDQRRVAAGRQRRLERQLLQQGDSLRLHHRVERLWRIESTAALVATVAGALTGPVWLMAVGAAGFCLGAGGLAVERLSLPGARARQEELERRLARLIAAADELEARARDAAERVGAESPWEATERIEALESAPLLDDQLDGLKARIRSLAARLGLEGERAAAEDDPLAPNGSGEGWPPELAGRIEGLDGGGGQLAPRLAATARLIERVERELPAPWPVVVWEPWPDLSPDKQAAWLLALAEELAPRALLAVVSGERGAR
jgi:hypothetical protein